MTVNLFKIGVFCDEPGICNFHFFGIHGKADADKEKKKK
jgi:hypothetical protein